MRHTRKLHQALADHIVMDVQYLCCQGCRHRVELVMTAAQRQILQRHLQGLYGLRSSYDKVAAVGIGHIMLARTEGIQRRLRTDTRYLAVDDRVLAPVDKCIRRCLVARDAELGIDIVLELKLIPVQMVGSDIHQDGDVGLEIVHIVELERRQLNHIIVAFLLGHLQRQAVTYIACQTYIQSRTHQHVVHQ